MEYDWLVVERRYVLDRFVAHDEEGKPIVSSAPTVELMKFTENPNVNRIAKDLSLEPIIDVLRKRTEVKEIQEAIKRRKVVTATTK